MTSSNTTQGWQGADYTNTVDYGYDPAGQLLTAVGKENDGSGAAVGSGCDTLTVAVRLAGAVAVRGALGDQ